MGAFGGFPKGGPAFFAELAKKQDRDWFKANKQRYETLWEEPMAALLDDLQAKLAKTFPDVEGAKPKVMRIYRDVRFSKDKAPFKTNIGAMLPLSSDAGGPGVYVHGDAKTFFVACGVWMMEPAQIAKYREAVAGDEGAAFAKEVKRALAKGFDVHARDALKRVPAPYAADHPRGELLRQKGFALGYPDVPKGLPATAKLVDWIATQTRSVAPIFDWLETALA